MKLLHKLYLPTAFALLVFITSCDKKSETKTNNTTSTATEATTKAFQVIKTPEFSGERAYNYVKTQVDFGPRVPNSAAHKKCANYLIKTLEKAGWKVTQQHFEAEAFDGHKLKLVNIIASYNPEVKKRLLFASHWDSRPFADQDPESEHYKPIDGANDGASGVGILLELANNINMTTDKPKVGIDIIFFDGEDYGQPSFSELPEKEDTWCLGSQYWSKNLHIAGYKAEYGILLDMVGAKDAKFAMEGTSMYFAPAVTQKIWSMAAAMGKSQYFIPQQSSQLTDDHLYVNRDAHIPMIDIIHYAPETGGYFGSYWHTHNDNMSAVDKNTLQVVGEVLLQAIYQEQ
jgi:glutaminyl-peptide cyclotransferase